MLKRFRLVHALALLLGGSFGVNAPLFAESLTGIGQQQENCNGVVKDATGETVIGASIIVKGTTNGTVTDLDGNFTLPYLVSKSEMLFKSLLLVFRLRK